MSYKLAAKLYKDTRKVKGFSQQLLDMARKEFINRNINEQDYSKMIDLLTCLNLQSQEMSFEVESYKNALARSRKRKIGKYNIDVRA
ncbi:hypothetical protein [Virgibacillus sp. SK37]|uniref:hypothetical protein n=1 Tax=Virgibacillus sp. SK37 TaxID=403957 RepID=UPI0004D1E7CE|nr:hypothetical protein [Virgibacillus sp. SK37]AIF45737.1 hypothetical protein X953_19875 [Virgibacillus sp. SK37]